MNYLKIVPLIGISVLLQACDAPIDFSDVELEYIAADTQIAVSNLRNEIAISGSCNQAQLLSIVGATATSYNSNRSPDRAIDNNLANWSRWSANGRGESITVDLGSVQTVDSINTAWFRANVRDAYFDVETSTNGNQWTAVLTGAEASGTKNLISYSLQSSSARYVKIIGQGNANNRWNTLTEVQVSGCDDDDDDDNDSCTSIANLQINSASSNDDYDENYRPSRAIDNDLDTESRWSSDGIGRSITLDLGSNSTVREISTAWYRANVRTAFFNVETSTNNADWQTVLYQASAEGTQGLIDFDVEDTVARYVRIVGQGNSASTWNSLIEVDVRGCGVSDDDDDDDDDDKDSTDTAESIALIRSLFDLEGGDDDLSPYRSNNSLVFNPLSAQHVTENGNGWRHELKMAESNRESMSDINESFSATIKAVLSDGSKTIVAQYHGGDLGTLVKVYLADSRDYSDTNESNHPDSIANNGIFDVYARLKPEGSSSEVVVNFGTMVSGESFDLELINNRGTVTVSAMGTTRTISVADSDQSYLKFGNYLQAQDPETMDNVDDSDDWADFYSDYGITSSVVTFTNVLYSN